MKDKKKDVYWYWSASSKSQRILIGNKKLIPGTKRIQLKIDTIIQICENSRFMWFLPRTTRIINLFTDDNVLLSSMFHQSNQTNTLQECFIKEVVLMNQTFHRFSYHQDYQYIALFFYDIDYTMTVVVLLQSRFFLNRAVLICIRF